MKVFGDRIRSYDSFSARINFTHESKDSYGTMCGGTASICLRALTLAFFIMRLVTLAEFDDSSISSFTIMEDRSVMENPISMGEFHQQLFLTFYDKDMTSTHHLD